MRFILGAAALLACVPLASAEEFDLIIRHGRVVDGTGTPAFFADVAVRDGHIARIGRVEGTAKAEIDAAGLIVAPGFIDVHTHADEVADQPLAENFLRMGVTSIVVGNCGGSALDVAKFYRDVEHNRVSINVTTLIGHNTVRTAAMGGSFDRAPTLGEMAKMKGLVDRAMQDGAVGLSTGLIYLPGTFAKTDEIVELAKAVTPYGGIYASHMRHEDTRIYAALDEVFAVARGAHLRAEVSHLKLSGENAWGQADKVLAYIEAARASGLDITQDQYAYTASSTTMRQLIPDDAFNGGHAHFMAVLDDPIKKADLVMRMKQNILTRGRADYAYAVVASFRHDTSINGMNILEAAKKLHGSDSLDAQIEVILDFEKNGGAQGVFHGMDEQDLQKFMRHPNTMIASDSGIREFGKDVPHPRGYGNNARVLGRYVRDLKVLTLEDAVRKMTSLPATTYRFTGRGELKEGNWADIAVFDPEKIGDPSTYADPHHYAIGVPWVLVNGVPVIAQGEHTGAKPGMACRFAGAQVALQAQLEAYVTQPKFAGAFWGVKVVSLDTGRTLFAHAADARMSPASNSKLYACALALDQLGGDYRIVTPLLATAPVDAAGNIKGDLIISGRGDPGWNPRMEKKDFWTAFEPFIAALKQAGVKRVTGDLVADATWLREPPQGAGWAVGDLQDDYGAEISAISLDENYVDLHVTPAKEIGQPGVAEFKQPLSGLVLDNRTVTTAAGGQRHLQVQRLPGENRVLLQGELPLGGKAEETGVTMERPADWFATCLREALKRAGIPVEGKAVGVRWPEPPRPGAVKLGEVASAPLREIVATIMKPSQNLKTDLVFDHLGELRRKPDTPAWRQSDELAVAALDGFLATAGVAKGHTIFEEGSGLSRNNLTTADATVRLLQFMAAHKEHDAFVAALPVAGVDGSLRRRMKGTAAEGNVRAKTGTLRYASSLSGYVTTAAGEKLAFSLMVNRYPVPDDAKAGDPLDELAVLLAQYGGK
ncbi:D-alanyl-D-alanine carboxypeptidase/D-alanyl-D-alanine-endopeptidase [Opitutus sp. GAS368]|uniref:D-alanyl-D-alanine carboxypeptidase/D-alanyl-D-alanine endopeptidase n=1 Tax=Opitutus sp. GAS368 TaxID=1882749 RepID=UPI00087B0147|nr:D-alanyl-D-alanine carboxypeptidase/D-alanyl-D-alanine-endopeptidase [Opitutus sp. GAS368]SDS31498.1 D-alanyl-D-alanine carboxypeptidase, serine-type, PBP4 family [Opitutus sp. GAS368]